MNQHVKDFIDYYIKLNVRPDYALMITGAWGSGKSFLVKNQIKKLQSNSELNVHYVSLYGLSSTKEIDDLIFASMHPILSNKIVKVGSRFITSALKMGVNASFDFNDGGRDETTVNATLPKINLAEFISDDETKANSIFVFDDFERCSINPVQILGYINYFVEYLGAKVIIISNPIKITEKNYQEIKEKVIGQELKVVPDFESAFEVLSKSVSTEECKNVLMKSKSTVKLIFDESGCNNLRALRYALLQFERIFKALPQKAKQSEQYLEDLISEFLPLALEHIIGGVEITALTLSNYCEDTSVAKPLEKYSGFETFKLFGQKDNFWVNFFTAGSINTTTLNDKVDTHHLFLTDSTPDWQKLWHWKHLSESDFKRVLESIELDLKNNIITEAGEILHIFGTQMLLVSLGYEFSDIQTLLSKAVSYAESISANLTYNVFADEFPGIRSYKTLGYPADINEFDKLYTEIKKINKYQIESAYPDKAKELLSWLEPEKVEGLHDVFDYQSIFLKFPVFKFIKATEVMDILKKYHNAEQWHQFTYCLDERERKLKNNGQSIMDEALFYTELMSLLREHIESIKSTNICVIGVKNLLKQLGELPLTTN